MTDAHTPGPWHIVVRASINGARIASSDGTVIGGVSAAADKPLDQKRADVRLIAAAPTMFDYIAARSAAGDPEATQIMESLKATATEQGERG